MDPLTLMAIATALQVGTSVYGQQQQVKAANEAQKEGAKAEIAGQQRVTMEGFKKRQQMQGTLLGGSPEARAVSEQGTMLTSAQDKRSLLG